MGVRVLNQLGAYVLPFLAVLAGHDLAPWALGVFGVAALVSRWLGGLLLDHLPPRTVIVLGLTATGATMSLLAGAHGPGWTLLAAVALVGLAFEIYEPATQESLARLTTRPGAEGTQADVYGLLGTSLVASGAVGGLLAAILLPLGPRWLIATDALTCLVAACVALTLLTPDAVAPPTTTSTPPDTRIPDPLTVEPSASRPPSANLPTRRPRFPTSARSPQASRSPTPRGVIPPPSPVPRAPQAHTSAELQLAETSPPSRNDRKSRPTPRSPPSQAPPRGQQRSTSQAPLTRIPQLAASETEGTRRGAGQPRTAARTASFPQTTPLQRMAAAG